MKQVIETNSFTVQGWMRTELDLKGNDLLVYAIIFGFSQTENQIFFGSIQYLSDFTGASKSTIQETLKRLVARGLLEKEEEYKNNVKFVHYRAKRGIPEIGILYRKEQEGIPEIGKGYTENYTGGIPKTGINNKIYNKIDNKKEIKEKILKEKEEKLPLVKVEDTPCSEILNYWNSKDIVKHRSLTQEMSKAIQKALQLGTAQDIKDAIDRYDYVLKDETYFYKYKWTLTEFLTRKNGWQDFLDTGSKWTNYVNSESGKKAMNRIIDNNTDMSDWFD